MAALPQHPSRATHWLLVGGLVVLLLLIGVYDEPILQFLTSTWQEALAVLGLKDYADSLQQGINGGITKRLLPAVATYAVLYLSTCFLLLRLLLPDAGQWRLALLFYAGALAMYAAIVVLNKFTGSTEWAYRLSRQLLDFVISPLPVAGLVVLFKSGLGTAVGTPPQRLP
ncbi:XrtX-associated membrane protein [Hymenobacter lapidarius]|uniref:XrtX-associated membrane protein n=1 Tax=Hymenobacter lapidarius TaxID=1908237 RepID=UPI000F77D36E|nr:hypothetical protein [Hymenobacter lapidarius]